MKFCRPHWETLQDALAARGLKGLITESGEDAATKMRRQADGEDSIDSYEPLLEAHMAIAGNAIDVIADAGGDWRYLLGGDAEDPIEGHKGQMWPRCPLCYINKAHEINCKAGKCELPLETGYDYMIDKAADQALEHWEGFRL